MALSGEDVHSDDTVVTIPSWWTRYWDLVKMGFYGKEQCRHCGLWVNRGERFCSDDHEDAYLSSTAW